MIRLRTQSRSEYFRVPCQGFRLAFALTFLAVAGCGGAGSEVSGTVTYKSKPLSSGVISFFNNEGQVIGTASIEDGKYTMRKVPAGPVKITVSALPAAPPVPSGTKDIPAPPKSIELPSKYDSPDESGLTYEVKSGRQEYPIDLK